MNCFLPLARKNAGICAPSLWSRHWPYPRHNTPLVVQKRSSGHLRHIHAPVIQRGGHDILQHTSGSGGSGPLVGREGAQIARRDARGEPDAVLAAIELVAVASHRGGLHTENNRL